MLKVYVTDDTCASDEAHLYELPLDTYWGDIQVMVRLAHPTCTEVVMEVTEEVKG